MNKENTCSRFLGLSYESPSCRRVKESISEISPTHFHIHTLSDVKCKSLIWMILQHNLISEDLGKAASFSSQHQGVSNQSCHPIKT